MNPGEDRSADRQTRWWPFGHDPNLRAADADREAIGEQLRRSHGEGRLDTNEFQQRIERCYEAKTLGELDALTADLPRDEPDSEQPWRRRRRYLHLLPIPLAPLLIAFVILAAASGHHAFWLVIPLFFLFSRLCWWRTRRGWVGGRGGWRTGGWL